MLEIVFFQHFLIKLALLFDEINICSIT